jgi:hypothetical protein
LGLAKLAINGPTFVASSPEAQEALDLFEADVLPKFA